MRREGEETGVTADSRTYKKAEPEAQRLSQIKVLELWIWSSLQGEVVHCKGTKQRPREVGATDHFSLCNGAQDKESVESYDLVQTLSEVLTVGEMKNMQIWLIKKCQQVDTPMHRKCKCIASFKEWRKCTSCCAMQQIKCWSPVRAAERDCI